MRWAADVRPATATEADGTLVTAGEFHVSSDPGEMLRTLLGSCVAACLYDPLARVGGMNHFLLPDGRAAGDGLRFGAQAMELLVNALLARGAARCRLRAKIFGGADLLGGLTSAGSSNARFALDYLRREEIVHEGGCLGGAQGRQIQFWPVTGRARQRLLDGVAPEPAPPVPAPRASVLELF